MVRSEGSPSDQIRSFYIEMVKLRGIQYKKLPDGAVGRIVVDLLANEIERTVNGIQNSEMEFLFTGLILQKDKMVRNGKDIRRLLTRRMDLWEKGHIEQLLEEAKICHSQLPTMTRNLNDEPLFRVYNRLMLRGKIREATRLITERGGKGGVLNPNGMAEDKKGPMGKTVFEVLMEKHPEPGVVDEDAFLKCEKLPVLIDVDITGNHIEKVARMIRDIVQVHVELILINGANFY